MRLSAIGIDGKGTRGLPTVVSKGTAVFSYTTETKRSIITTVPFAMSKKLAVPIIT